jgi:hypothetical protein
MLLPVAPASAISVQKEYAKFADCPFNAPGLKGCVVAETTSGEFTIGSRTVPITKTITIQGGLNTATGELIPAADGNTLSKTPLTLPGGLLGIPGLEIGGEVTATAELAGTAFLHAAAVIEEKGVGAMLPLKVKLSNPALGEECYIGSPAEPVLLQLTSGTTSPPGPNKPISGKRGDIVFEPSVIIHLGNNTLVDNAFSAPGVNGCGGLLAILLDPAIDLDAGLPAAAGQNTAILNGTLDETTPASVKAHLALPEFGRCVKVPGTKVGKFIIYHGGYTFSDCIEENGIHGGPYEWLPGPGPEKKFTGASGAATLATTGGLTVKCSASTSAGEYTGTKAATATVTFTGCARGGSGQACQSAGHAGGEIVTNQLDGRLGFITDTWTITTGPVTSVGLDLKHEPTLITAECGSAKVALAVSGSVIGALNTNDRMVSKVALKFAASHGAQSPEAFEGEPKDTLTTAFGSGSGQTIEPSGLAVTDSITDGERIEIKAEAE